MKTCYYIAFAFAIVVVLAKGTIGNDTGCLGVELLSNNHFANFSSLRENGSRDVSQPGSKLKCSCSNSGSPQKMQWLGPDKMALATKGVVRVRQRNNSRTLVLILTGVINCTYAGVYTCQLENNIDFEVPYLIFPKKGNCSPQNITIDVVPKPGTGNSSVVLKCWSQSSAIDLLQYLWMVNGENQTNITNCLQVNVTQNTTVTCTVSNIFGSTSVSINIPVQVPDPPTFEMNQSPIKTCQSIQISWTPPINIGGDNISRYTVTYYSGAEETEHRNTTSVNGMSITLNGLTPNTEYTVIVSANNSQQTGEAASITVRTDNRGLGKIMAVKASISATSVRLQHPLGSAVNYKCNILGSSTDQFNIPANEGRILLGLSADTTYTVNCVAFNGTVEHCLEATTTFKTLPGRVVNVQLENMGMVTMDGQNRMVQQTISWQKPTNHSSTLNYTIKYGRGSEVSSPDDSSAKATTATGSNTTATLSLLLPTSTDDIVMYKVWVAARSSAGQGKYSEQLNIRYTAPTQPKDVTVVPLSCNSVNITWKPPVNPGNLTITQYTIQYHDPTINMTTGANTTFIKVNNLIPGKMYTAQVKASNGFKDSGLSVAATNTTQMRGEVE